MKKLKLIRDGMNLPFRVAPFGPNEPALTGVYRPMTSAEVSDFSADLEKHKGKATRVQVVAAALAKRVLSWDVDGEDVTPANLAALPPAYLDGLELIVAGYVASGAAADDEKKS